jgi:hypothetical protein
VRRIRTRSEDRMHSVVIYHYGANTCRSPNATQQNGNTEYRQLPLACAVGEQLPFRTQASASLHGPAQQLRNLHRSLLLCLRALPSPRDVSLSSQLTASRLRFPRFQQYFEVKILHLPLLHTFEHRDECKYYLLLILLFVVL